MTRDKKKIIIAAVVSCVVIIVAVGIYFVRREWKRYAENSPLYIVPVAYDFPYKDYHHNKRIHFVGFSLLVPDDFSCVKRRPESQWVKSPYSSFVVHEDCFNGMKATLDTLNIHCASEYAAELYMLSKTPDDCISINPSTIMRNYILKTLKSITMLSDARKI